MVQFSCRFAFFINFTTFKPDAENSANFEIVIYYRPQLLAVAHYCV